MNALMTLTMIVLNVVKTTGVCPRSCECKWKSGKESVLCLNANMTEIPKELDSGTQVLVLTGNRLQKIGADEFFNASLLNLQKIFMSRCKLRFIDRSSFRKIINLVELDLSYNDLHSVPSHTFEFIKELRELRLNGNPIVRLLNYAFKMVPRLTKLDLSECRIAYVEIKAFQGLENSLEWLKLDKNKITNIKPQALLNLGNLHGLELSGNSWNCSCGLRTLREWMLKQNVPYSVPPICIHPPRLFGKIWDRLDLDEFACTPRIEAVTSRKNGEEGSNVTMSCSINGIPEPSILWLKKNHIIANLSGTVSGTRKKLYIVQITKQTSNLTILAADAQDNGVYVCRAENKAGKSEANITLTVTVKPLVKIWTPRMIIAIGVVSLLFVTAIGLLTYCAWSLRKRKSYLQHPSNRRELMDGYEMKHKNPNGYNKIRDCGNYCSDVTESFHGVTDPDSRPEGSLFILASPDQTALFKAHFDRNIGNDGLRKQTEDIENRERSESTDSLSNQRCGKADMMGWNFLRMSDPEDKPSESLEHSRLSPDLHISRLNGQSPSGISPSLRNKEKNFENSSFAHSVVSSSFLKSKLSPNVDSETTREISDSYTSTLPENREKFPDLLELSQNEENLINNNPFNTMPRKKNYKLKRTRHGSLGSESQSPLLAESSGDSCDSSYCLTGKFFSEKNASLPTSPGSLSQTPILNILDGSSNIFTQSPASLKNKSWELERFLKEYRYLQDQLCRMKESCENLKEDNLKFRESKLSSNAVESATISKMISPVYLEDPSYKTSFLDEANNFGSFYDKNGLREEDYNNSTKPHPKHEIYWSSGNQFLKTLPNSQNSFYKS